MLIFIVISLEILLNAPQIGAFSSIVSSFTSNTATSFKFTVNLKFTSGLTTNKAPARALLVVITSSSTSCYQCSY